MAEAISTSVQDELDRNVERGLWFAEFRVPDRPSSGNGAGGDLKLRAIGDQDEVHPSRARAKGLEVVLAGKLLNRTELSGGQARDSSSDAAVLLQAYRTHGREALARARGAFAVLVLDRSNGLLLAARDPLGMCPLFVSRVDGLLVFSTSVEGMLRHPSVPATINKLRLVDELRHTYPDPEETHYAAIRRIMPGHLMVSENGQVRLERYWDPLAGERVDWLTEAELDGFIDLFDQAVARCLQFGRAGVFLSGGLDSVSVAAVTADVSARAGMPAPLALSLRFPHPDVDESEIQRNVARQLGLPHVLLSVEEAVSGRGIFGAGLDMCRTWAAPLLNPWLPAYGSLFVESREQGCGVALTGGGGDEWLAVGPYLAADMVRTGDLRGLKFVWDTWGNSYRVSTVALLRSLWKFGFWPNLRDLAKRGISAAAPGALPRWARWRRSRSWPEWLAPGRQLRSQALDRARQESELVPTGGEKLRYYLADGRQALEHPMASMEMEEDFEMGRRLGVLEMDPYWDPDLVDFLYRTPPELLLRGGRGKGLVRWMLSERFPDLGFERQKKVTSTNYFLSMILEGAPDAWRRVGGVEALSDLGIIDGGAFQRAARDTIRERRPGGLQAVWEVLMMEAWLRGRL